MRKQGDRYSGALWILEILEKDGHQARLAGGCVRDRCLGNVPSDYDIATTALPDEVTALFSRERTKVVPTGIDHGTVTIVLSGVPYEVTTLRQDVKTDGRHAEVVFGHSFEMDAARRDFTINAIFEDRSGKIYDYFGGQEDLRDRVLRFVGEPRQRIREDFLRILRFFRFWARFGLHADPSALVAIAQEATHLEQISKERITIEVLGLFAAPNPRQAIEAMVASGVFSAICDEIVNIPLDERIDSLDRFQSSTRALARFALLLGEEIGRRGEPMLEKCFRLSRNQTNCIVSLASFGKLLEEDFVMNQALAMELLDSVDRFWKGQLLSDFLPAAEIIFPQKAAQVRWFTTLEQEQGWLRTSPMPVDAKTLMEELKIPAGPQLGKLLKELKSQYRNRAWRFKEEGLALATQLRGNEIP